ncbi:hypothetical protein M1N56_08200 [Dehalococcoidia bacterium]|nr:hypothetical protein [Dehalococcoidia bacterium]
MTIVFIIGRPVSIQLSGFRLKMISGVVLAAWIGSDPIITIMHAGAMVSYWPVVALVYAIRRGKASR